MAYKLALSPKETVVIVWDVQKGLVKNVFNREEFLRGLNNVLDTSRKLGIPIIFTKITPFPQGFEHYPSKVLGRKFQFSSEDLELEVQPKEGDIVMPKNTWSAFVGTNLELLLRNSGRRVMVLTGIATEIGVETTARHAFTLGYLPVIVKDAVSSYNREGHERSLANMSLFFPVVTSTELRELFGS